MRLIVLVAAGWLALGPLPAHACLNPVLLKGDRAIQVVKRGEALLKAGKYAMVQYLLQEYVIAGDATLERRATLLELTAAIRTAAAQRPFNVDDLPYATERLRELHDKVPDDPLIQARLAEALALNPDAQDEARKLIEDLVARDLMPEAEAWLTAARVRANAADREGSKLALERCAKVARGRKQICRLPES